MANSTTEQIRWQNSLTQANSALLSLNGNAVSSKEEYKEDAEELANFFYNLEPKTTELHKQISECTSLDELEALKEVVKFTDSITMFNLWNAAKVKFST